VPRAPRQRQRDLAVRWSARRGVPPGRACGRGGAPGRAPVPAADRARRRGQGPCRLRRSETARWCARGSRGSADGPRRARDSGTLRCGGLPAVGSPRGGRAGALVRPGTHPSRRMTRRGGAAKGPAPPAEDRCARWCALRELDSKGGRPSARGPLHAVVCLRAGGCLQGAALSAGAPAPSRAGPRGAARPAGRRDAPVSPPLRRAGRWCSPRRTRPGRRAVARRGTGTKEQVGCRRVDIVPPPEPATVADGKSAAPWTDAREGPAPPAQSGGPGAGAAVHEAPPGKAGGVGASSPRDSCDVLEAALHATIRGDRPCLCESTTIRLRSTRIAT
jgi:hypothetical protein